MKKAAVFDVTSTDEGKATIRRAGMKVANTPDEATGLYHGTQVPAATIKRMIEYALGECDTDDSGILDIYGSIHGELECLGVVD